MRAWGLLVACVGLAITTGGCWLQPGFDAGRTSWNRGESALTSATIGEAVELWSTDTGVGAVDTAPLSFNGTVVAVADPDVAGQPHKAVRLDAATGATLWTTPLTPSVAGQTVGSPVYLAGVVHVPSGIANAPQAGTYRVDATSGTVLGLSGPLQTSRLSVADGTIATLWRAQSLGNGFAVINWKYQPTMRADFGDPPPGRDFAIVDDRIMWNSGPWAAGYSSVCPQYPGLPDEACLPDWAVNLGGNAVGIADLGVDRVVYTDVTGTVTALDAATGTLGWTAETGSTLSTPIAVAGGSILVTTDDNRLLAVSATDGTLQWQAPLTGHPGGPVAAGDVVYVPVGSDVVAFALTGCGAASCQPIATLPVGSAVTGGPIVDDGRVVVGTADGRLVAFGLAG